jgi:NAD kinase
MNPEKIIIIPSKSRYELELEKLGDEIKVREEFRSDTRYDIVYGGHLDQKANIIKLEQVLGNARFIDRDDLSLQDIVESELIVSLGGDNHFMYVSHLVSEANRTLSKNIPIAPVVLDPNKSTGALLGFDVDSFINNLSRLFQDDLCYEYWTLLEANVWGGSENNPHIPYKATGDYFLGEEARRDMSRCDVYIDGKAIEIPEKNSGILVSTGAGSTGWYDNVHGLAFGKQDVFFRDERIARIIATENRYVEKIRYDLHEGQILRIESYCDNNGICEPDSIRSHNAPFRMGYVAEIKISDQKLIILKNP